MEIEEVKEKLGNQSILDLVRKNMPEIEKTVSVLSINRENTLETELLWRPAKADKLAYLQEQIELKRKELTDKGIMPLYHVLSKPIGESIDNAMEIEERFSKLMGLVPSELPNGIDPNTLSELVKITGLKTDEDFDENKMASKINDLGAVVPTFKFISNVEDITHSLMTFFLYVDNEFKYVNSMVERYENIENESKEVQDNKEFTTARQVLAIHYLLKHLNITNIDNTEKARFIQFLTGKETGAEKIKNTTIYKFVRNPFKANEKDLISDLRFVRDYFEKLGLTSILTDINKEIGS